MEKKKPLKVNLNSFQSYINYTDFPKHPAQDILREQEVEIRKKKESMRKKKEVKGKKKTVKNETQQVLEVHK